VLEPVVVGNFIDDRSGHRTAGSSDPTHPRLRGLEENSFDKHSFFADRTTFPRTNSNWGSTPEVESVLCPYGQKLN
jgi:hypothetical protein